MGKVKFGVAAAMIGAVAFGTALSRMPMPKPDHTFDRITLPDNHEQCLPNAFRAAAKPAGSSFEFTDEDRNAGKLLQKTGELATAEATYAWLVLVHDPLASQATRDAALMKACAAGRAIKGDFPNQQVLAPLVSVQMGDDWIARYQPNEYQKILTRTHVEHAELSRKADDYRRARITSTVIVPPAVQPALKIKQRPKPAPEPKKRSDAPANSRMHLH